MAPDRVTFEPATDEHALALAPRMRAADQAEVLASGGRSSLEAIQDSILWSRRRYGQSWAGLIDGQVAAVFGIGRRSLMSQTAFPWALTGDLVDRHPLLFWRGSKAVVTTWLEEHEVLEQYVDARYQRALRWLARLGFSVEAPRPFGLAQLPFHRVVLRRMPCANP